MRRSVRLWLVLLAAIHLAVLAAPWLTPHPPQRQYREAALHPPGGAFPLGTDALGRDIWSRVAHGGRVSLLCGLVAATVTVGLGTVIGGLSGLAGGAADRIATRATELVMTLPWLYLLLAVRAFLPVDLPPTATFVLVVLVIASVGWARPARLVRGIVVASRNHDAVRSAIGFGASTWWVFRRHMVPAATGVILTQVSLLVPQLILAEVTLTFLGLGVAEPVPSWGGMLADLQQVHLVRSAWWLAAPILPLLVVVFCYHRVSDALLEDYDSADVHSMAARADGGGSA